MKNTTSWILVLLIGVIGAAGGFWFGSRASTRSDAERLITAATQPPAPAETMTPAPDAVQTLFATALDDLAGKAVKLDRYKGKTLIVNFWASWCPPCIAEMPELSRFYQEHGSKNIQMIGIAIDNPTSVRNFLKTHAVSYPVYLGGMGGTDLSAKLGDNQGGLPFTVIITPDGRITYQKLGQTSYTELQKHIP